MTEPSLAELAGHDLGAQRRLVALLDRYRREGITGLRAQILDRMTRDDDIEMALAQIGDDLVEAVLTIAEQRSRPMASRRSWEDFDADEARSEAAQIRRGGNR